VLEPEPINREVSIQDRLLAAAEQVVARDGVRNLTLEAVAREAGVSKGGLLYHYPAKAALIQAIVERFARRVDADQGSALQADGGQSGAFTRAYVQARTRPLESREVPVHTALLAAAGHDPQYLDPFRQRLAEWQARLGTDGIDPATANVIRFAIDGMCLCSLLGLPAPDGELRQKIIDKLLSMTRPQT
jgi:AcrR family transcriptional regulator